MLGPSVSPAAACSSSSCWRKSGRSTSGCGSPRWRVFKSSLASVGQLKKARVVGCNSIGRAGSAVAARRRVVVSERGGAHCVSGCLEGLDGDAPGSENPALAACPFSLVDLSEEATVHVEDLLVAVQAAVLANCDR